MELEEIRQHCLLKPGVTEDFPFDESVLAFRVMGKIFLLTNIDAFPQSFNVKCEPELAVDLRDQYDAVQPGYHMNKKHWNTIMLDGTVEDALLIEWIDHSYARVAAGLTRAQRDQLKQQTQEACLDD